MIIMSVDYGDARTGIAVCDKNELLASPICVVSEWNREKLADKLSALAVEKKAELIVVGLPKNMDGSEGYRAQACREFGELLHKKTSLNVVYRDERLSTVAAYTYMNMSDTRGKKRKETVDAVAAVIILEDYLKLRKNTGCSFK